MSLVPGPPVVVPFSGDREVQAPMTLGQRNIVQWLSTAPDHRYAWLHWTLDVPVGTGLDDLAGAFSVLVSRHEGLRTVYLGGEAPSQRVIRAGTLAIDVYHAADGAAHADATAEELLARLGEPSTWECDGDPVTGEPRLPPRLPLRVAVAVHGGSVCAGVVRYSHLAVDLHAMAVIGRELAHLLTSTGPRVTGRLGTPHQPVDLAAAESAPLPRGRHESALRRWEEYLRRMPASLYAAPRTGSGAGTSSGAGSGAVLLSSTAAALALRHIHSRTRTSQPSIVLAAVCAVLAQRTGGRELHLPLLSSNRFKPELADYVGTLVQATMLVLNLADAGFDTLVRRTFAATLEGARLGVYDADRLALTRRQIEHERGIALSMEPVFNNLVMENRPPRPRPVESIDAIDAIASAAARTRLRWQPMPRLSTPLSVELLQVDGAVRLRLSSGDLTRAGRPELEALLLAVERLIVAAAGGDLDCRAVHDVIGLAALSRGPDWLYLDYTWVDLAEMRRLLAETFAPAVTRVVATRPAGLVAYLAVADGPVPSPGQAHARCLAGLPGRVAVLTPRSYVICAGTPEDPDDPVAWQRLPVLADGSGREVAAATGPGPE